VLGVEGSSSDLARHLADAKLLLERLGFRV